MPTFPKCLINFCYFDNAFHLASSIPKKIHSALPECPKSFQHFLHFHVDGSSLMPLVRLTGWSNCNPRTIRYTNMARLRMEIGPCHSACFTITMLYILNLSNQSSTSLIINNLTVSISENFALKNLWHHWKWTKLFLAPCVHCLSRNTCREPHSPDT